MKRFKKIISLALVGAMLLSASIAFTGCSDNGPEVTPEVENSVPAVNERGEVMGKVSELSSKMMYLTRSNSGAAGQAIATHNVHCTVTPSYATNKNTTWSIAWGAGAERASEHVGKYIRISAYGENNNYCAIELLSYFGEDSIILTVTTEDGGFTASCDVTCFEGVQITRNGGDTLTVDWYCEAEGEECTLLDFNGNYLSELFSVNIDSRYKNSYNVTVEGVFSSEGDYYIENSEGDRVSISQAFGESILFDSWGEGGYYHYYYNEYEQCITARALDLTNVFSRLALVGDGIFISIQEQSFIQAIYTENGSGDENLNSFAASNGYPGYTQPSEFNATLKPVIFKITVSESVFNTSDTVYVSIRVPVTGVETTENYIYEH